MIDLKVGGQGAAPDDLFPFSGCAEEVFLGASVG